MKSREKNILDAAVRVFSRYGVKRANMSDVAQEAGISRQTLYKAFKNKGIVLRALIRHHTDLAIIEICEQLQEYDKLGDRLRLILHRMAVSGFDMIAQTPNAKDIVDGFNESGKEELERSARRFQEVIFGELQPYAKELHQNGMEPERLARLVQRTAKATSAVAVSREDLIAELDTLILLCLNACGE